MTGRCPRKSLQFTAEVPLAFLIASFFKKKSATFKVLNLECTDVSFNPENGAFSKIKRHTDRLVSGTQTFSGGKGRSGH